MKMRWLLLCVLYAAGGSAWSDQGITIPDAGRQAYTHPVPGLAEQAQDAFFRGRALFHQIWVVTPSLDESVEGLGPLYNQFSCSSCHANDGPGYAPDRPDERMRSMLIRLSVPGTGPHGGPKPAPAYGDQLNEQGIPGVAGEGNVEIRWETVHFHFPDGEVADLRRPTYKFENLAYGPLQHFLYSPRVAPPIYGTGLLDAVPGEELIRMAREPKPDGVTGKVNRVWDARLKRSVVGKFGLKSNAPNLRQQIAAAFIGDMGITSELFPAQNCTPLQTACRNSPATRRPELTEQQLDEIVSYVANLAVPARRNTGDPEVRAGAAVFVGTGCAVCHRPELETGPDKRFPILGNRRIHPYTDLLLHDMGPGLADGRPDFKATGNAWRTPPLWGIGLAQTVNPRSGFLHDGRAQTLQDAILWHDGEGWAARNRYVHLARQEREALLAFLGSL